jgi:hypothetical protein
VSFTNIAVGEYGVMAGVKGVGRGHAKVSVTNSSDVDVTVTLEPRKAPAPTTPPNDQ